MGVGPSPLASEPETGSRWVLVKGDPPAGLLGGGRGLVLGHIPARSLSAASLTPCPCSLGPLRDSALFGGDLDVDLRWGPQASCPSCRWP